MEVERFKTLLERVTNFNWEEPRNSALREEFEERRARIIYLWSASTDEAEKAKVDSMEEDDDLEGMPLPASGSGIKVVRKNR